MKIGYSGDRCVTVSLGRRIHPRIHRRVRLLFDRLDTNRIAGIEELVPTFCSVSVFYDPLRLSCEGVVAWIRRSARGRKNPEAGKDTPGGSVEPRRGLKRGPPRHKTRRTVEIPVCYEPPFGPDLETVAEHARLSRQEVVRLHSGTTYLVYMLGFTPGFPYLGGLPSRIATPRLGEPRTRIPAGSVGIAGDQTGVYPIESPGGWQIIGRTPLRLFSPDAPVPFLLEAGDRLSFVPISADEFQRMIVSLSAGESP